MDGMDWAAVGVTVWLIVATLAGLAIGQLVVGRDRQVPAQQDARVGKPERHDETTAGRPA